MPGRSIPADQLPAAVRRRYGIDRQPPQKDADRTTRPGRRTWRCHKCGTLLRAWAAAERHVDSEHGTARVECILADSPARR